MYIPVFYSALIVKELAINVNISIYAYTHMHIFTKFVQWEGVGITTSNNNDKPNAQILVSK